MYATATASKDTIVMATTISKSDFVVSSWRKTSGNGVTSDINISNNAIPSIIISPIPPPPRLPHEMNWVDALIVHLKQL